MKTISLADFLSEAEEKFGKESKKWKFICPQCKTEQTAEDFIKAGIAKENVNKYIGFSCIGRWDKTIGCNWTLGGAFQIHEIEIISEDGKKHPHFELAEK